MGSIGGLQNFASNLAGIFTPILIGAANYLFVLGKVEPLKVKEPVLAA